MLKCFSYFYLHMRETRRSARQSENSHCVFCLRANQIAMSYVSHNFNALHGCLVGHVENQVYISIHLSLAFAAFWFCTFSPSTSTTLALKAFNHVFRHL